ncbi:MAG: helix-turn-helix domain-containing protein [Ferruginibacter sp.]
MGSTNSQLLFFQHIKSILPDHISFVDEIAALLGISNDSAYRRIRGEKPISMDEMHKLASHFKISIDQFLHIESGSYIFSGELGAPGELVFENWVTNVLRQLSFVNSFTHKHLYYLAKDVPIMDQFMVPDLLAFKSFLWRRSILQYEDLKGKKFSLKDASADHLEMGRKIEAVYLKIPTTEIWNVESINSTIRQIEFYREADMFEDTEDVKKVYEALLTLINHLEHQSETGLKFRVGESPGPGAAAFNLFWNDLVTADNTLVIELDLKKITFLNHSVLHFISTTDVKFNSFIHGNMQNLIKRSTQLSRVGEKDRYRFFNNLRDKIKLNGGL